MKKDRSSPPSFLFPWVSPLVIKFAVVDGGIEVQLYRNNRLLKDWQPSMLGHALPEPLTKWIDDHHIDVAPQPYPLVKQLWRKLMPLASKKVIVDSSVLAELEEVSPPQDFALVWTLNRSLERIEGRYEGADRYLGMGWFQKGTKIWPLHNNPSNATYSLFENLLVSIQQADVLLNSIIPYLQHHLPTRADFHFITDFALRVIVPDARSGRLVLALQCNYPQFLPTIQVPQQKVDVLLANQAIIRFPHQSVTPVMLQLMHNASKVTLQGADVPLFISEALPVMRHYRHISDDMAAKITQSNPIVSIATLRPTLSFIHTYEDGVGKYTTTATYQYQQHILDMDALIAAHQQNQRFVQQHAVWFEWPHDSNDLFNTIQQQRATKVLLPEEVMGFDTRRVALLNKQPTVHTIQLSGVMPVERGQSLFEQLRQHGIPGGIVGEPKGLVTMFVNACENVLRDNQQASILWLVPSTKKGIVVRTINASTIRSYVTVASFGTLHDESALVSRSWTLVIFQGLNQWLDEGPQSKLLSQLKWQWALTSVTSRNALSPSIMQVLHLPKKYYEQFCARYFVDLESTSGQNAAQPVSVITAKPASAITPKVEETSPAVILSPSASVIQAPRSTVQPHPELGQTRVQPNTHIPPRPVDDGARPKPVPSPISRTVELNEKKIAKLHQESEELRERLIVEDEEGQERSQFTLGTTAVSETSTDSAGPTMHAVTSQFVKPGFIGARNKALENLDAIAPTVQLDQEAISKLREESEQLRGRLLVETEEEQEQFSTTLMAEPVPVTPMVNEATGSALEVDEDWKMILQRWQPEHWEIILLLYEEQYAQLTTVERKVHRPVSLLIDEINLPVDEQLGDLLVDPDTQTISNHLQATTESLVRWYFSSKG